MPPAPASFYEQTKWARKIIVVDLGFLGDSVHLVPALWEIKRHYPEAQLHTLSATVGAELLGLAACVDRPWAFPLTPQSPPWWRHWDIIGALRREKFDAAFNFNGADRTIFMTALTGAKWRLAHEGGRRHFWNRWLIANWVPRQSQALPVWEQRRQVLAAAGFPLGPARFDLRVPEKARESVAANIPANTIHLSINASTPFKEWPLENWAELAVLILKSDPEVQLVATAASNERESARLNRLADAVPDARLVCLPGLNIGQLAALLQRCRLHLGGRFRGAPSGGGPGHFHLYRLPQISRLAGMASARRAATQVSGGGLPVPGGRPEPLPGRGPGGVSVNHYRGRGF